MLGPRLLEDMLEVKKLQTDMTDYSDYKMEYLMCAWQGILELAKGLYVLKEQN